MRFSSTYLDARAARIPVILLGCAFVLAGCGNNLDAEKITTVMKGFGQACDGPVRTEFHLGRNDSWLSISCDDIDMEKLK